MLWFYPANNGHHNYYCSVMVDTGVNIVSINRLDIKAVTVLSVRMSFFAENYIFMPNTFARSFLLTGETSQLQSTLR